MKCNCAGTAPGYPQHEAYCGQEPDETPEPSWLEEVADTIAPLAYWRFSDYMGWTADEG